MTTRLYVRTEGPEQVTLHNPGPREGSSTNIHQSLLGVFSVARRTTTPVLPRPGNLETLSRCGPVGRTKEFARHLSPVFCKGVLGVLTE